VLRPAPAPLVQWRSSRSVPRDPADARYPPADLAIARIGDLLYYDLPALFGPARAVGGTQETT